MRSFFLKAESSPNFLSIYADGFDEAKESAKKQLGDVNIIECRSIKVTFPNNEEKELEFGTPLIILGANGSGKTRISVKIQELNDKEYNHRSRIHDYEVHRICAQKSLSISEKDIIIRSKDYAEKEFFIGNTVDKGKKYQFRFRNNPYTKLISDYEKVLSYFFALNSELIENYHESARMAQEENSKLPYPVQSLREKAEQIWNDLLPKRTLSLKNNNVYLTYKTDEYHGDFSSDGERVILYMILQTLILKPGTIFIIDEPELHIHKAVVKKLWDRLETERPDCIFIYLTHDLDFAVSRNNKEVMWIKSYDGDKQWDYEFLEIDDYRNIDEGLLFELIGTQRKILFVEGDNNSKDYQIYQSIFSDYHVIPCGSCEEVIKSVKSKNQYSALSNIKVWGIIDRDYRTEKEITSLQKSDDIFVLDLAEVENLFIVPELLLILEEYLGKTGASNEVIKFITEKKFSNDKKNQINYCYIRELKYQLEIIDISAVDIASMHDYIINKVSDNFVSEIFKEAKAKYDNISDYKEILKIYNKKELPKSIDKFFGLATGEYEDMILRLLNDDNKEIKEKIINAIKIYLPEL